MRWEIFNLLPINTAKPLHWSVKRQLRITLAWLLRAGHMPPAEPWPKARVTVVRHSSQQPDHGNLVESAKPLLDVLQPNSKRHPQGLGYIVDDDPDSYWATDDDVRRATLEIDLGEPTYFDRILLQEPIRFGQRISAFAIEARVEEEWTPIARGTTIGYKRLLRITGIEADRVRIVIEQANNVPALSNFGLFKASSAEVAP